MRIIILLILYLIFPFSFFPQTRNYHIHSIRFKYFVISSIPDPILKNPSGSTYTLFRGDSPIGAFRIIKSDNSFSICELVSGSYKYLDNDCYFMQNTPKKSTEHDTNLPNTSIPIPAPQIQEEISTFSLMNLQFRKINGIVVSPTIPFSRFGTIEELNGFLDQLDSKSQGKYKFTIPSELLVTQNPSLFSSLIRGKFGLCLFNGRIGYFLFSGQKSVFKNIQLETLAEFSKDILVIIVSTEV